MNKEEMDWLFHLSCSALGLDWCVDFSRELCFIGVVFTLSLSHTYTYDYAFYITSMFGVGLAFINDLELLQRTEMIDAI